MNEPSKPQPLPLKASRRRAIQSAATLAAGVAAGGAALATARSAAASAEKFRWRLVLAVPRTLPIWASGVEAFAKRVEELSVGRLQIRVYGAGELVPALGVFDAVKSEKVEMGHGAAYYWQGKMPASPFFCTVPFGMDPGGMKSWLLYGGGQALWDELYGEQGVKPLPAGSTTVQMGGWYRKPIRSVEDFKGLKIRIPGLGGQVLSELGAKPTLVAGGEIYTNLSTGVIDAAEWVGPYHDTLMGFQKVARNYHFPGWHEPGPVLELIIGLKAWNSLPSDLKAIVQAAAAELDRNMHSEWITKDAEALIELRKNPDIAITPFPTEVLKKLQAIAMDVRASLAATSPLARRIAESHDAHQKKYEDFLKISRHAYLSFKLGDTNEIKKQL